MVEQIKGVFVRDNEVIFKGVKEDSLVILHNENSKFTSTITDESFNILNFIKKNELCIQQKSTFNVAVENGSCLNPVSIHTSTANSTIHKNIQVQTDRYLYKVDLVTDNYNELQVSIERVLSEKTPISISSIHIEDEKLHFTIEKSDVKTIEEIGILLTNNLGKVQGIACSSSEDNKATFEINLKELAYEENINYGVNLILDGQILPINFDNDFNSFKQVFERERGLIIVNIGANKSNDLTLSVRGGISIKPVVTSVTHSNGNVSITGKLNSDINYLQFDKYRTVIKLVSSDGSKSILEDVSVVKGTFTYTVSEKEFFELKDTDNNAWSVFVCVYKGDLELTSNLLSCERDFNEFSKTIYDEVYTASLSINANDSGQLQFLVKSSLTIEQILSIQKRGKKLLVKFRTKENIEKALKSKRLTTDLKIGEETLKCKKVIQNGKKTYSCIYKVKDLHGVLDTLIANGVKILSTIHGSKTSQIMHEINEMVIYRSFIEVLQNTKKYKNLTSNLYKNVFLNLPVKKDKVMFESFLGRNISGQPKYIYEHMVKKGMDSTHNLIWVVNDLSEEIEGIHKKVKRKSLKYYYHMATSGKWVFNARQADDIVKRPQTTYLQTWHGTPLKRLAGDMTSVDMGGVTDINAYKERFFRNSKRWDYLLAQNDYSKEILSRAFNFKKDVIMGYPANDILYTKNTKREINKYKAKLGIPQDKKVILYAPTWREDNFYKKGHYKLDLELELDKMQEKLGDEYIVIIRAHYLIANSINLAKYKDFVYDFSKGYDIQELYLVSDILITDYSSTMFDFANLKRPIIFFAYDLEKYRDNLRGFYFDFEKTAPGPIVKTTEGVINAIENIETVTEEYKELSEAFYNKFCHVDHGKSAEEVVKILFKES